MRVRPVRCASVAHLKPQPDMSPPQSPDGCTRPTLNQSRPQVLAICSDRETMQTRCMFTKVVRQRGGRAESTGNQPQEPPSLSPIWQG